MTATLLPLPEKIAHDLPHHQRADVWLRVWIGVQFKQLLVAQSKNMDRRQRCEFSLRAFLLEYMGSRVYDLCPVHEALIQDYEVAILSRSKLVPLRFAFAAPRSVGKSTIGDGAMIWAAIYHHRDFVLYVAAAGTKAPERLAGIRVEMLTNKLLAEDFPDIIGWLHRTHEGDPRRAPPDYPWNSNEVRLPNGVIIAARSVDGKLAGTTILNERPDFVIMDDLEDADTVRSTTETRNIEENIRLVILKIHNINKPAAYFFICTIRARGCLADRYTDPTVEPEWRGKRFKALIHPPKDEDSWERFREFCKPTSSTTINDSDGYAEISVTCSKLGLNEQDFTQLTTGHQTALRYYAHNKDRMDAGAVVLDPVRLPLHVLEYELARDPLSFYCELQNEPPKDETKKLSQLDEQYILSRRIGPPRKIVPPWASFITATIDVGAYSLHWEVDAWGEEKSGAVIDFGKKDTNLNQNGKLEETDGPEHRTALIDSAIRNALAELRIEFAQGYMKPSGETLAPALTGIDCGGQVQHFAWYGVILRYCASTPRCVALKGQLWTLPTATRAAGRNWLEVVDEDTRLKRYDCNADEYKLQVMRAYEAPVAGKDGKRFPGSRIIFTEAPANFARHQTSERYIEVLNPEALVDKQARVGWVKDLGKPNHYWDTSWMAYALYDIYRSRPRPRPIRALAPAPITPRPDYSMG